MPTSQHTPTEEPLLSGLEEIGRLPGIDYCSIFQTLPGLFLIILPDGPTFTVLAASDAYLKAVNFTRQDIVGRGLVPAFSRDPDPVHKATLMKVLASFERVLLTRKADTLPKVQYDVVRSASEGGGFEERYWRAINMPVIGPNGEVRYIVQSVEDLTELHRREEWANRSEEKLRLAAEAGELGLWTWDVSEDRSTWENDRMYEIFGLNPQDGPVTAARFFSEFVHPDDATAFHQAFGGLSTQSRFRFTGRFRRTDGETRWVEFTGRVYRSAAGAPNRIVGTAADLTDSKQAERRNAFLVRFDDATRPITDAQELTETAVRILAENLNVDGVTYRDCESGEEINFVARSLAGSKELRDRQTLHLQNVRVCIRSVVPK